MTLLKCAWQRLFGIGKKLDFANTNTTIKYEANEMTQALTTKLNPIDDATLEAYIKQVLDVFTQTPVKEFSAHDVTKQARSLHATDFIEHKPAMVHADMLNRIAGGLDYERESVTDATGASYWLYKHVEPAAQTIQQAPASQTTPTLGIQVEW